MFWEIINPFCKPSITFNTYSTLICSISHTSAIVYLETMYGYRRLWHERLAGFTERVQLQKGCRSRRRAPVPIPKSTLFLIVLYCFNVFNVIPCIRVIWFPTILTGVWRYFGRVCLMFLTGLFMGFFSKLLRCKLFSTCCSDSFLPLILSYKDCRLVCPSCS